MPTQVQPQSLDVANLAVSARCSTACHFLMLSQVASIALAAAGGMQTIQSRNQLYCKLCTLVGVECNFWCKLPAHLGSNMQKSHMKEFEPRQGQKKVDAIHKLEPRCSIVRMHSAGPCMSTSSVAGNSLPKQLSTAASGQCLHRQGQLLCDARPSAACMYASKHACQLPTQEHVMSACHRLCSRALTMLLTVSAQRACTAAAQLCMACNYKYQCVCKQPSVALPNHQSAYSICRSKV